MTISISHTMSNSQFENKENLKKIAKSILSKQQGAEKAVDNIINKALFNNQFENNSQVKFINAQAYMIMNTSLKETLNYLNNSKKNKKKNYVLGELKSILENSQNQEYTGELFDFEIDSSVKNIFAA